MNQVWPQLMKKVISKNFEDSTMFSFVKKYPQSWKLNIAGSTKLCVGHLAVNLRRDVDECEICTPKAGGCNCRGRSFSEDFGLTWSPMELGWEFAIPKCLKKE